MKVASGYLDEQPRVVALTEPSADNGSHQREEAEADRRELCKIHSSAENRKP